MGIVCGGDRVRPDAHPGRRRWQDVGGGGPKRVVPRPSIAARSRHRAWGSDRASGLGGSIDGTGRPAPAGQARACAPRTQRTDRPAPRAEHGRPPDSGCKFPAWVSASGRRSPCRCRNSTVRLLAVSVVFPVRKPRRVSDAGRKDSTARPGRHATGQARNRAGTQPGRSRPPAGQRLTAGRLPVGARSQPVATGRSRSPFGPRSCRTRACSRRPSRGRSPRSRPGAPSS